MKKVVSIIVLVSFISVYLFCEDSTAKSDMLNFDTQVSGKIMINSLSPDFDINLYGLNHKWTPYLGSTEISEVEFYSLAGFSVEEKFAASRVPNLKLKIILIGLGAIALGTGIAYLHQDQTDEFWIPDSGSGLSMLGASTVISAFFLKIDNMTTARQAQLAADSYNAGMESNK